MVAVLTIFNGNLIVNMRGANFRYEGITITIKDVTQLTIRI